MNKTGRRNFLQGMFALIVAPKVPLPKLLPPVVPSLVAMPEKPEATAVVYTHQTYGRMVRGNFAQLMTPGLYQAFLEHLNQQERFSELTASFAVEQDAPHVESKAVQRQESKEDIVAVETQSDEPRDQQNKSPLWG